MAEITREQVERLLAAARAEGSMQLDEALPEWYERCPVYVREAWRLPGLDAFLAALTRWRDSLPVGKVARFKLGEWVQRPGSPPFRVRSIFEDSGGYVYCHAGHDTTGVREDALVAAADPGWRDSLPVGKVARWDAEEGHYVLTPPITDDYRATTDPYAAIAWGYTIEGGPEVADPDPLAYADSPAWDEPAYSTLRQPAPEVVDVPQPETWHARLVRLAREAQAAGKACAEAEAAFAEADLVREKTRLIRAAAREACHAARKALTAATTAAAIVEAAEARQDRPERPEPRFKVGDWVRAPARPREGVFQIIGVHPRDPRVFDGGPAYWWHEDALVPALDPALHETARKTIAALRELQADGPIPDRPHRMQELPGYAEWRDDPKANAACDRWAAQLERLLGEASHG